MKKFLYFTSFIILIFISYILINNKISNNIYDSIVYIETTTQDSINNGTGFVYEINDNSAYILTNYHVIEDSYEIYIYNKNKVKTKAKIVKYDAYNDIALLEIDKDLNLKKINIGDSSKVNNTDEIYIIGNPMGKNNFATKTSGIIIDKSDSLYHLYDFNAIKVSAKTDFGSSGSPLLDKDNKVIGIIFLKNKDSNESYAIPINYIIEFLKDIEGAN